MSAVPAFLNTSSPTSSAQQTVFRILAVSFCHLLNDMVQSLIPSLYPILKSSYGLDFGQLGILTLAFQMTASIFQPFIGFTRTAALSRIPLPTGVGFTLCGLLLLPWPNSLSRPC